ncbi:reverse transcriptase-like protein [Elysia marginata]|uniref:Reverse transcriptase-like protein n=1 Tax=Elysia marginata TaxID=1093978 RepID=A0AAV4EZK9_9GAST|nr:reverse transcriptase-like protein [Elysia marginata]
MVSHTFFDTQRRSYLGPNYYTKNITVIDKTISGHYLLSGDLNTQKPSKTKCTVTSKNWKMLEPSKFSTEFYEALKTLNNSTVSADCLDNTLRRICDQLLPLQARTISQRPVSPWFSLCIKVAKQHRRRAERRWRKTRLTIHRHIFMTHRHKVKTIIQNCKREYFLRKFETVTSGKEFSCLVTISWAAKEQCLYPLERR